MGQQHDFYLVQTGNLVPRSASWRGFLACFQQPNPLRSANLDSSEITGWSWNFTSRMKRLTLLDLGTKFRIGQSCLVRFLKDQTDVLLA